MNLKDLQQGSVKTIDAGKETYEAARASVAHLRSRTSKSFLHEVEREIREAEKSTDKHNILTEAKQICELNWALVLPFFNAVKKIPADDNLILKCSNLARQLAVHDIDAAITFLNCTPVALENLEGSQNFLTWGQQGLSVFEAAKDKKRIWKAVRAYFIESSEASCRYPLEKWSFFLDQALRIAAVSIDATEGFIQHGNNVCLLLNEDETINWIDKGLESSGSEQELVNYFNGTSLKSIEASDCLVSGVPLKTKRNTLSLICEALLGQPVKLRSNNVLLGCKGFNGGAATDGHNIFLPEMATSFGLFKLMALHQAMLLQRHPFTSLDGTIIIDPVKIHLDADMRLIRQLPGLLHEMNEYSADHNIDQHPEKLGRTGPVPKPWWGDILPDLMKETDETITAIKEKAAEKYENIPPELLEGLLTSMLAGGEREQNALWKLLGEMLDDIDFDSPDPEELQESVKTFFYKEWDRKLGDYKLEWCQVRQRIAREDPNDFVTRINERLRGIILLIRKQFMKLKPEMFRKYRAQPTGDALDIDALVQALTDMRSGAPMSENVYIRRDKRIRDVSVFFLVDLSGSTDEVINGRRVIDVQKEAMAIMAEALEALGDPYAIYGFSSEGRFRVDMFNVKDFNEPYDETAQYRLGNLQPLGLTRMGTVVRHATYKLEEVSSAIKILIILTDGRPYDMEYGNLEYAISDTKKAIQEARIKNIHPFIITSDKKGSDYLQMISPQTECVILPKVELLPTLLPALYRRLTG
ncbi:MAG: VWA domain-containing protein [Desulfobulbaceae bacterium]|nr:VWA domain-containing protein [Desulfobulbaceae bacterium]